ncbi:MULTISPECIES: hypothetical protein [unclassified Cryobacterium]|uniref:hypothetical protein n=1 Tax=unclassified Cryobacterium TaxID=2649013 RepID=UPI002AB595BA|nr:MULTISPECIES: hypothetical protein [unclassified Cryobacterium]MDY7528136.1 hypothetical protein [Cryobacterium sp. 10C2]MDY7556115.1 hypothetical protein [Cryobacterium sp. 10C3]MEB0292432.1 hypothetical protein [Cryobacterium sp. 10C2]
MGSGTLLGQWNVFFHPAPDSENEPIDVDRYVAGLAQASSRRIRKPGTPFLIGPDGFPDPLLNDFFVGLGGGRKLALSSARAYAYSFASFCNVLHSWGVSWREADQNDIEAVRTWRLHDPRNPRRVQDKTWEKQYAMLTSLYSWAAVKGIRNPLPRSVDSRGRRVANGGGSFVSNASVKWFSPSSYERWRDIGLVGILPDGRENESFRGRNSQRDSAFANALFQTGLRVQELGNVLLGLEWPDTTEPGRRFYTRALADGSAKGSSGRKYWIPASAVSDTRGYVLGERMRGVLKAQKNGVYDAIPRKRVIKKVLGSSLQLLDSDGVTRTIDLRALVPEERLRIYSRVNGVLEPVALWLGADGVPYAHQNWNKTFARANDRIADLGLDFSRLTPHHLRHSFALRWFSVGSILWSERAVGLTHAQVLDLREEMGSHWYLVQTLLGHRNESTTRDIYLEPFQGLDVEILLDSANDESVSQLLSYFLSKNSRVHTVGAPGDLT